MQSKYKKTLNLLGNVFMRKSYVSSLARIYRYLRKVKIQTPLRY
jgi:hypothetical protein